MFKQLSIKIAAVILTAALIPVHSSAATNQLIPSEQNTIAVFKKRSPYVVNVHRLRQVLDKQLNPVQVPVGNGSGFIWNEAGYIVTNYHVISGSQRLAVTINGGKAFLARFVNGEPRKDIAVLKVDDPKALALFKDLTPMAIADSDQLSVGQKTIAIGNPYGLDRTLTTGIISALGRRVPGFTGITIRDLIQTDASINPGNSGGPLLNSQAELIGMNTMIFSRSGSSSGIGFAVPSNDIKRIVEQIIKFGKVKQPGLGFQRIDPRVSIALGVKGVLIGEIFPGSSAAKAGLRGTYRDRFGGLHLGDVIVAIDDSPVKSYDDLYNVLSDKKIGQTVKVSFLRDSKLKHINVKTIDLSRLN